MNPSSVTTRYNDDDLKEFKIIIDSKLDKARSQYASLKEQLKDITENNNDDFAKDITDFSSIQTEVEMLDNMANHQRKYIQDLENALIRINNKSYGICVVSGELRQKKANSCSYNYQVGNSQNTFRNEGCASTKRKDSWI